MKKYAFGFECIFRGTWSKEGQAFALQTLVNGVHSIYMFDLNGQIQTCFEMPLRVSKIEYTQNCLKLVGIEENMMYLMRIKQKHIYTYLQ